MTFVYFGHISSSLLFQDVAILRLTMGPNFKGSVGQPETSFFFCLFSMFCRPEWFNNMQDEIKNNVLRLRTAQFNTVCLL